MIDMTVRVIDAAQLKHRDRLKSSVSLIAVSSIAWLSVVRSLVIVSTLILSAIRL